MRRENLTLAVAFLAFALAVVPAFREYERYAGPQPPVPPSPPPVDAVEPPPVNQFKIELVTDSWFTSKEYRTEYYEIVEEPRSGVQFYGFYDSEGNLVNLEVGQNVVITVLGLKKG